MSKEYFLISLLFIFFILLIVNTQKNDQMTCPIFVCSSSFATIDGSCFYNITAKNVTKIVLHTCQDNQFCNLGLFNTLSKTGKNNVYCQTIPINVHSLLSIGQLVEYDYCFTNNDCASMNCTNNICYGKATGSTCQNTTECDSNSYCDNVCQTRKKSGNRCLLDYECYNNASCFNGICTEYFSLKAGEILKSNSIKTDMKKFCFSKWANSEGVCEDLLNVGSIPFYCNLSNGCQYLTSNSGKKIVLYEEYCSCNLFGNGYAQCMLATNTVSYYNNISAQRALWNLGCHYYNKNKCSLTPNSFIQNLYYTNANVSQVLVGDHECITPRDINVNPGICQQPPCDDTRYIFSHPSNDSEGYFLGKYILKSLILIVLILSIIYL